MNTKKRLFLYILTTMTFLIAACTTESGTVTYVDTDNDDSLAMITATVVVDGELIDVMFVAAIDSIIGWLEIIAPGTEDYFNAITSTDVVEIEGEIVYADDEGAEIELGDGTTVTVTYNLESIYTDLNFVEGETVYDESELFIAALILIIDGGEAIVINSLEDIPFYDAPVYGCTDPDAANYYPEANTDDGTCTYDKITICHVTNSATNAYLEITISVNGLNGHLNSPGTHSDDIIPAPEEGCPGPSAPDDVRRGKPDDVGKPDDAGRSDDAGRPDDVGKPDAAPPPKPEDAGKPDNAGKPDDAGKPDSAGKPDDAGKPDNLGGGNGNSP